MAATFTSSHRLLLSNGFDQVLKGENISDRNFKVFFVRSNGENARLGIISSKRILPRAVDRNSAKRLIREVFRHHDIKTLQCDIVVMVRPLYQQEITGRKKNLDLLLTKVKNRCADC